MRIFEDMAANGVTRDEVTYNSAICACDAGGQSEVALQLLQQMVSVLTARGNRPPTRDRGISNAGLMEEGQLYAVCMQEVAAQMAVHSPALSELGGALFHGFVNLFQRSVSHQEAERVSGVVCRLLRRHRAILVCVPPPAQGTQRQVAEGRAL